MKEQFISDISQIQFELNAPKGQTNAFGKYKYRSCEDILTAVKPLLKDKNLILTITDSIEQFSDRIYVKATAKIEDGQGNFIENNSFAREALSKKGMDDSQVTGAASSYARKYALNGLFCIDDTKDADSQDNRGSGNNAKKSNFTPKVKEFDTSVIIKKHLDSAKDLDELKAIWSKCNNTERSSLLQYKEIAKERIINETMDKKKQEKESQELDNEDIGM